MKNPRFCLFGRPLDACACSMAALIITLTFGGVGEAQAQIRKEDNVEPLNLPASWVLGAVPDDTQIAQWDNQLTFGNDSILGANQSWLGIRVLDPAGGVTITGLNPDTLATDVLTLGASGIDMSNASQNLTISSALVLGSAQSWNVASGRVLHVTTAGTEAISGPFTEDEPPVPIPVPLTINGRGTVRLGGLGATYTATGGVTVTGGNVVSNVAAIPGSGALISASNLTFDLAAIAPSTTSGPNLSFPSGGPLTVEGVTIHTTGGARASGSGNPAWIQSSSLSVLAGQSNFTQLRGSSARVINSYSSTTRATGGTLNFRDHIPSNGSASANGGGYRMSAGANVNGIVPFVTYTNSAASTSWFAAHSTGTSNNGTSYNAFTASTADSLGTSTQNSTVSTDVLLSGTPAVVNSIRFNDPNPRTVTIDTGNSLTIGAGAILVTNNGTANQTITGGTLMGGNPGSGSGYDLIVHQLNNTSSFTIDSVIADNTEIIVIPEEEDQLVVTPTALTKTGAGILVVGGPATYTGPTFVNAGTLQVNGSLDDDTTVVVQRGATLGGTGSIPSGATVNGSLAPGAGVGTLSIGELTFGDDSSLAIEIDTINDTADKVIVTGGITTGGNTLNLVLTEVGGVPLANDTKFTIVDYSTTWSGTGLLTYQGTTVANESTITLGANTFIVNYSDAAVDGTALTLTVTGAVAGTPFQNWVNNFAAQLPDPADRLPTADPDGDGRDNLLEFALEGNPTDGSNSGKLAVSTGDSNDDGSEPDLSITLAVRDDAVTGAGPGGSITLTVDGVIYTIQASQSLLAWDSPVNEVAASSLVPAPGEGWTARTFKVTDSDGLPDKRFIRVGVGQ